MDWGKDASFKVMQNGRRGGSPMSWVEVDLHLSGQVCRCFCFSHHLLVCLTDWVSTLHTTLCHIFTFASTVPSTGSGMEQVIRECLVNDRQNENHYSS